MVVDSSSIPGTTAATFFLLIAMFGSKYIAMVVDSLRLSSRSNRLCSSAKKLS